MTNGHTANWREWFSALAAGDAESQAIMDAATTVSLPADRALFYAGSPCDKYLLLLAGSARVQVIGEGGRTALLYRVLPGQPCVLTTCCILAGADYPAEGFTETEVTALVLGKPAFDRAIDTAPAFRRFVFAALGARLAEVISRMEEVAFRPVEEKLAAYLLTGPLDATHQAIALELGTAREVVSRHLKRMEIAGLVRLKRNVIEVVDADGLAGLSGAVR